AGRVSRACPTEDPVDLHCDRRRGVEELRDIDAHQPHGVVGGRLPGPREAIIGHPHDTAVAVVSALRLPTDVAVVDDIAAELRAVDLTGRFLDPALLSRPLSPRHPPARRLRR